MNSPIKANLNTFEKIVEILSQITAETVARAYLVGGAVRDFLIGRETLDYDVVIFGPPLSFAKKLASKIGGEIKKRSQFQTIQVRGAGLVIDLARARGEVYSFPGALPKISPTDSLNEDLQRRDFTINAIAFSLLKGEVGKILDPFSGRKDLKKKKLRVLYRGSFRDDPTRAFRGIRYRHRFSFSFHWTTQKEFHEALKVIPNISFERVKNELMRISEEENRALMFEEIYKRGLIESILGSQVKKLPAFEELHQSLSPPQTDHWIYFFSLFLMPYRNSKDKIESLPLRREERRSLHEILSLSITSPPRTLEEAHTLLESVSDNVVKTLALFWGEKEFLEIYLKKRRSIKPYLTPYDLMSLGIKKGPFINKVINSIKLERLKGKIKTQEDEKRFVIEKFLKNY